MSADNGFIIRKNADHKFVLQEYSASADDLPPINDPKVLVYDTLEQAAVAYANISRDQIVEYGLSLSILEIAT